MFKIFSLLVIAFAVFLSSKFWYPGLTPESTVEILVHDMKWPKRAFERAKTYDDKKLVDALRKETNNFKDFPGSNIILVAEVLASKNSDLIISLSNELLKSEKKEFFLIGAYIKASNGLIVNAFFDDSRLLKILQLNRNDDLYYSLDIESEHLALATLGKIKDKSAMPSILEVLKLKPKNLDIKFYACGAIENINGPDSAEKNYGEFCKDWKRSF